MLLSSFGLDGDRGLQRLGGNGARPRRWEALATPGSQGFEAVLPGAGANAGPDDDALLADIRAVLDSLHAHFSTHRKP